MSKGFLILNYLVAIIADMILATKYIEVVVFLYHFLSVT